MSLVVVVPRAAVGGPPRKQLCTRSCSNKHTHRPASSDPHRYTVLRCVRRWAANCIVTGDLLLRMYAGLKYVGATGSEYATEKKRPKNKPIKEQKRPTNIAKETSLTWLHVGAGSECARVSVANARSLGEGSGLALVCVCAYTRTVYKCIYAPTRTHTLLRVHHMHALTHNIQYI
jgi:hypothetical protein